MDTVCGCDREYYSLKEKGENRMIAKSPNASIFSSEIMRHGLRHVKVKVIINNVNE